MCTDTTASSSLLPSLPCDTLNALTQETNTTTKNGPGLQIVDSTDTSPSTSNKDESTPLITSTSTSSSSSSPKAPSISDLSFANILAKDFWDGKQTVCEYEKIATWLGTSDPFRACVLQRYMDYFDFTNQPLDEAFRNLCAKLFFKAESQQMDRIIEAFAKKFWECNPIDLYHSADVVYAMAYSLLLLNTDLHGVQEHHQKMKKARFVKNTMDTISTLVFDTSTTTDTTKGKRRETDSSLISPPVRRPSIDTSTLSRKHSLGVRQHLRKTKSHHNLAMSPKRSSFWRGSTLTQKNKGSDNNITGDDNDDEEDETVEKNTIVSADSSTFITLCKAVKGTTTKSQSLIDLPYYLKNKYAAMDGDRYQTRDERRWMTNIEQLLKDMYTSIKSREIIRPVSPILEMHSPSQGRDSLDSRSTEIKNKQRLDRRKRGRSAPPPQTSSTTATTPSDYWTSQDTNDTVDSETEDEDNAPRLYSNHSPCQKQDINQKRPPSKKLKTYRKDITSNDQDDDNRHLSLAGWVMRKCLMQGNQRKAKQRNWKKCYLKIQQGKLVMQCSSRRILSGQQWINPIKYYRHGPPHWRRSISVLQYGDDYGDNRESDEDDEGDDDDDDINIDDRKGHVTLDKEENIDLNHSLSRILPPPGWHGQRNHVVCLQTSDGASWLFQVHTHQKAQAWTRALNYWAALHSKEPLPGGVTNVDYGWNNNSEADDEGTLPSWRAPASCSISSQLSRKDQLEAIDRYIERLSHQADQHRHLRKLVEERYPTRKPNGIQAMTNWELKMQYLLFENIKFQTYHDSLSSHIV
ncbi:hypothetical protein BC941DRAFT_501440 [Chlamydoabsidia padenii]|nr:hypothetical protein BC941DRAFT_501440 [Chlamydoabsidia padenii]